MYLTSIFKTHDKIFYTKKINCLKEPTADPTRNTVKIKPNKQWTISARLLALHGKRSRRDLSAPGPAPPGAETEAYSPETQHIGKGATVARAGD